MKKIRLSKRVQIVLITLFVIVIGVAIVTNLSNDEVMAADLCVWPDCDEFVSKGSNKDGHGYVCPNGHWDIETHDTNGTRQPKFFDLTYHGWYSSCSECGWVHYSGAGDTSCGNNKGKHDLDSNGVCVYCEDGRNGIIDGISGETPGPGGNEGDTCTCNGSTSYYEDYRKLDDELHTLYYVCNICGGEWRDAEYIHKFSGYIDNGNGTHSASCKRDCGYSLTENHTFENGVCTAEGCGASEECEHDWEISDYSWPYDGNEKSKHANWYVCSICGENGEWVNDTIENHSWRTPVINDDGTHTLTCDECGWWYEDRGYDYYQLTEEHTYENGTCTGCGAEEPISEIEISSTKYKIEGTYIYIQPTTKTSEIRSNITTNATEIKVYGNDEEISDNAAIVTGMTIELKNGQLTKTFTIIVKGDVNSDGVADFKDLVKINKARLNKITLEEMYVLAADVNADESLDLQDLSKINRYRLNKITEL